MSLIYSFVLLKEKLCVELGQKFWGSLSIVGIWRRDLYPKADDESSFREKRLEMKNKIARRATDPLFTTLSIIFHQDFLSIIASRNSRVKCKLHRHEESNDEWRWRKPAVENAILIE